MTKILIIEDESAIRRVLSKILQEESKEYEVFEASDGIEGLEKLKKDDYDLVLCDIKMPKMDGLEVLTEAKKIKPEVPFVMISGHGDLETAVNAMRLGAYDYISKPPDLNRLLNTVRNALDKQKLVVENKHLKKKVSKRYEMIGESAPLQQIRQMIEKVAPTEARVLITGSNGTGKELVAHAIHCQSERAEAPMIEVNCAAIPSELIESELFGHIKGAFTSAVKDRAGKFEAANNGTITRVGSDKDISVDVRVIAATNKDLKKEIAEGRFREDLYHRLAVILIKVPSLNERRDDIPLLISHFSDKIAEEQGISPKKFSKKAIELLQKQDWTGNIRELRNVVERLFILGGKEISEDDVKAFAGK